MLRRPPRSTRTDTLFPYTTLFRSTASDVEVRVERGGGFSQEVRAAGRIGASFLQRYRVLLDPGAGRMVLAPGRTATAPPLKSTSGLLVGSEGRRLDGLPVLSGTPRTEHPRVGTEGVSTGRT